MSRSPCGLSGGGEILLRFRLSHTEAITLGFALPETSDDEAYARLTDEWRHLIIRRREALADD